MSDPGGVAGDQLRAFVERIERLEEEKKVISDDIKDVPELSEHVGERDLRLGRVRDKASRNVKQKTLGHGKSHNEIVQHFFAVGHSTPPQIAPETASLYRAYVDWSDRCSTRLMQPEAEAIS